MPRHTRFASLPLYGGKAPSWRFQRVVRPSCEIEKALNRATIDRGEKVRAFQRLARFSREGSGGR